MEFLKIINTLSDFNPKIITKVDSPTYIQTHKMLTSDQLEFSSNCLYVGYVSELPETINTDNPVSIVCIADSPLTESYKNLKEINLVTIANVTTHYKILNIIADIMIDEAHITSSMQILLDGLYENKGLQNMVDIAFEVFGNPIFINDTAYKILAMSKEVIFEDAILEEEKSLGYIHNENVSSMRQDGVFKMLSNATNPLYSKQSKDQTGWLFNLIKIQNVEVGVVALSETIRPFRNYDFELLERFSKLISIELEKTDFYKQNKGIMYNYFLADLISDKLHSRTTIEKRLSLLQWNLYSYFQIIFIADLDMGYLTSKIQRIAQEIKQIIIDCRWTVYKKNLVVFLNRPSGQLLTKNELERLYNFLNTNNLAAGMSNTYTDILETPNYYKQAMRSVELGIYLNHKSGIYRYTDYMLAYIGKILSKRHDLDEFCPQPIKLLQDYDKNHNSNLLETLDSYLFYPENPVAAAKSLHIHRNTLTYRINKIKEISNLDIANGDERLKVQLYFKFKEYQQGGWEEVIDFETL